MRLRIYLLAFILPALLLAVSCKKNNSTSSSTPHVSITGEWAWQYTTGPVPDTVYPRQDSSIHLAFTADNTFTLSLNGKEKASGTFTWQDTILVLTSSTAINLADYAQSNIFNGTNPSEYFVAVSSVGLQLSKNFIIPGATTPYQTPIEPQILQFVSVTNAGGTGSLGN